MMLSPLITLLGRSSIESFVETSCRGTWPQSCGSRIRPSVYRIRTSTAARWLKVSPSSSARNVSRLRVPVESDDTALAYRVAEDIVKDLREIHQAGSLGGQERRPLLPHLKVARDGD